MLGNLFKNTKVDISNKHCTGQRGMEGNNYTQEENIIILNC